MHYPHAIVTRVEDTPIEKLAATVPLLDDVLHHNTATCVTSNLETDQLSYHSELENGSFNTNFSCNRPCNFSDGNHKVDFHSALNNTNEKQVSDSSSILCNCEYEVDDPDWVPPVISSSETENDNANAAPPLQNPSDQIPRLGKVKLWRKK